MLGWNKLLLYPLLGARLKTDSLGSKHHCLFGDVLFYLFIYCCFNLLLISMKTCILDLSSCTRAKSCSWTHYVYSNQFIFLIDSFLFIDIDVYPSLFCPTTETLVLFHVLPPFPLHTSSLPLRVWGSQSVLLVSKRRCCTQWGSELRPSDSTLMQLKQGED